MVDSWFFTLYQKHVPCTSWTSLIWVLYIISIFLGWRIGFEHALQLNGWSLMAEIWEPLKMKLIWGLRSWTLTACVVRLWIMAGESRQKSKNDTLRKLFNVASEISIKKLAMALGRTYFSAMFAKSWKSWVRLKLFYRKHDFIDTVKNTHMCDELQELHQSCL